ncbi:MAG: response regulator transcription factor [Actinomycetota bacterium]|jgi:DNA-binding response OmpR family regulator|nr:response regulator transcription factor [Actinomycetota bacterium]
MSAMAASPAGAAGRVLVVDDDPGITSVVAAHLRKDGYDVEVLHDGQEALASALGTPPRLMVLDLSLPGMNGLQVLRVLRGRSRTPVILLSNRRDEDSRVNGLRMGADDYVTKPFSPREVAARVEAVLRRSAPVDHDVDGDGRKITVGGLTVDLVTHEACCDGKQVALTLLEQALLVHLMRHPGRTFDRGALLEEVWGFSHGQPSAVTVEIRRLRQKVELDPSTPRRIQTMHGRGYRFQAEAERG